MSNFYIFERWQVKLLLLEHGWKLSPVAGFCHHKVLAFSEHRYIFDTSKVTTYRTVISIIHICMYTHINKICIIIYNYIYTNICLYIYIYMYNYIYVMIYIYMAHICRYIYSKWSLWSNLQLPLRQLARHFDGHAKRKVLGAAPVPLVVGQVICVRSLWKLSV